MRSYRKQNQLIRFVADAAAAGACLINSAYAAPGADPAGQSYADPNRYTGSDCERINAAVRDAHKFGGRVRIGRRKPDAVSDREKLRRNDRACISDVDAPAKRRPHPQRVKLA